MSIELTSRHETKEGLFFEALPERAARILKKAGSSQLKVYTSDQTQVSLGSSKFTPGEPYLICIQNPPSGKDRGITSFYFGEGSDEHGMPSVQLKIEMLVSTDPVHRLVSHPSRSHGFDDTDIAHINGALDALETELDTQNG